MYCCIGLSLSTGLLLFTFTHFIDCLSYAPDVEVCYDVNILGCSDCNDELYLNFVNVIAGDCNHCNTVMFSKSMPWP